ncbi:hypothetical protein B0J13DRAFT_618331 [Dactylonectria estremocensis]|uniref:THUMP domain-containing protein n=1 Tax=Dactylonectria estremocensis TaxID=1079267 RepID=A0A9P9JE56_9HYPO|nr:hypothetical protein B0J13DRAFT_618331 [Dactylonectria estremocensis]
MSDRTNKRKQQGPGRGGGPTKKSKGGHAGKWQTPFQKARYAEKAELGRTLEVNDAGIWVTYARGMRGKAMREFRTLCNQYGESLFGVKAPVDPADEVNEGEDADQDIEASIQQELESFKEPQPKTKQVFTAISTGLECVFFMKTTHPIDSIKLIQKMCQDAKDCPDPRERKTKYVNRLTPVQDTDKASENGIERVARSVLAQWFELKSESSDQAQIEDDAQGADNATYTYAIRHNIRNHTTFKSDAIIRKIAGLVSPKHKVNLGNPDKVILVEIFQTFCGVSVVDGKQWEELKRYNLNELYKLASDTKKDAAAEGAAEST